MHPLGLARQLKADEELALALAQSEEMQIANDEELARRLQLELAGVEDNRQPRPHRGDRGGQQQQWQGHHHPSQSQSPSSHHTPAAQGSDGVTMVTGRPVSQRALQQGQEYKKQLWRGVQVDKISSQGIPQKRTLTLMQYKPCFKLGAFLRSRLIPFPTIQYIMEGCAMSQPFMICYGSGGTAAAESFCCSIVSDERRYPLRFSSKLERDSFLAFCRVHFTVCEAPHLLDGQAVVSPGGGGGGAAAAVAAAAAGRTA